MFPHRRPARLPPSAPPRLAVLIDVEEEFDWSDEFDRGATRFQHIDDLERGLDLFASCDLTPVGVMTYPVVEDDAIAARLAALVKDGRLIAGAHLHPWVTPPHDETVDRLNSFPGNLPRDLEAAKLSALTRRLEERLGERPRVYQAGRYGVGEHTSELLEAEGFTVGMSVTPPFDMSPEGGPDFSNEPPTPFWYGATRSLLELPITGAFVGWAGRRGGRLMHHVASSPALGWTHVGGLLARLRAVERLRLSPEGHALADMQRLTRDLLARGERVFVMSLHSPSLKPGCTHYVRSADERDDFLERCRRYASWFKDELGGVTTTPLALRESLLTESPPTDAAESPS